MTLKHLPAAALAAALALAGSFACGQKHELVNSKDGTAIGYRDTPIQPWSGYHVHDPDRPVPKRVDPGPAPPPAAPPSDAIVLFDGKDLSRWKEAAQWEVKDGCLVAGLGSLATKDQFGDCQLHVEWQVPETPTENWANRGNNGVMLLGLFEIQIYDSHTTQIYPDGQAAAIYAQTPPLVNACRKPGEWQTFDIVVTAPTFEGDKLVKPARVTMHHNGVLVHLDQEVYGSTPHLRLGSYAGAKPTGPVALLGHHCPVKFRNIWIRPLELSQPKKPAT